MTEIIIRDDLIHLRNDHISYVMGKLEGGILPTSTLAGG